MSEASIAVNSVQGGVDEPPPRDLLRELRLALAKCTPKQRAYLRKLADHNFQLWGKARTSLGLSSRTISNWLRNDRVKAVRALQDEIAVEDYDITQRRVLSEYTRIAFSDLRDAFDSFGRLKPPSEWSDEIAAAMSGIDTQEKRLKDPTTGEWLDEFEMVRKIKVHDKLRALEFLADFKRMAGAKKVEVTGADGKALDSGPSVVNVFIDGEPAKPSAPR